MHTVFNSPLPHRCHQELRCSWQQWKDQQALHSSKVGRTVLNIELDINLSFKISLAAVEGSGLDLTCIQFLTPLFHTGATKNYDVVGNSGKINKHFFCPTDRGSRFTLCQFDAGAGNDYVGGKCTTSPLFGIRDHFIYQL
jgi:hypothetical protein